MGGFLSGAAIGTAIGPVGTVAGSIVGGVVGCALASEMYETVVHLGADGAEYIADQAEKLAHGTIELVEQHMPEKLADVKAAFG